MKLFVSLLLLAGTAALATPARAQQATRPATESGPKPAAGRSAGNAQTASLGTKANSKPTWQQRRALRKKKLTPYAEAMLHNELLREEPAKKTGAGLL
ncbi:hypothetical protein [Hymenobacter actinosclerus]|uniref:Uncharacterized protein n=1 Tax=Hymenobacter actinosclerus TaxID=82805 RepID=A0A1H9YX20_9BACT|nr:hypothetical protein [Hymenobacter actinosclerus]SES73762.1 hypothetical protein SAMN04487998_0127 [Hymenobacter actinosclerus]